MIEYNYGFIKTVLGAKSIKELPKRATFIQVNRTANTSMWDHRI